MSGAFMIDGREASRATARQHATRAVALDVMRGLAILMMVFSGIIPFDQSLPRWMFHAQEPPTVEAGQIVHHFNLHLPGLTWVDLVFPLFLFALGASIPLAFARRMDGGPAWRRAIGVMLQRLLLLGWFAVFLQHVRPYTLANHPTLGTWAVALLGFALLFPMFTRLPPQWTNVRRWTVRGVGYGGAVLLLAWLSARHYPDGGGFRLDRSDIILIVFANMACFGTGLWLLTRDHLIGRLGALGLLLAFRLASGPPGWVHQFWDYSPVPWLFQWDYLKYLFIVVPGTFAGDLMVDWMQGEASGHRDEARVALSRRRLGAFAVLTVTLIVATLAGLEGRQLGVTTLVVSALGMACVWLTARPVDATGRLIHALARWGLYWIVLGLVFEPFEGGIHKDPSTLSFYFVTSGLACLLLGALTVVTTAFGRDGGLGLLAEAGQNPMIAYVAMGNLLWPCFAFGQPLFDRTHLAALLGRALPTPWLGVAYGALETFLLALVVRLLTRRGIFWRT